MGEKHWSFCAYCGRRQLVERDHVVPIGLFPLSTRGAAQFVFRNACASCNRGFSKDEEDLRNFCAVAGTDFPEARELFFGPMARAFNRAEGAGPFFRMWGMMSRDEELKRYRINPGESVFRALTKVVRGLTHNHFDEVVAEQRVDVAVCPGEIADGLINEDNFIHLHPLVFSYWYVGFLQPDVHSVWLFKILQNRVFCAMVHP
jgi:hypothetical protein